MISHRACELARRWRVGLPLILAALSFIAFLVPAQAADPAVIAHAENIKPQVGARLAGAPRTLIVGTELYRDEQLWTTRGARLGVQFIDGSRMVLGENARVVLDEFVFSTGGSGTQLLRSLSGALRFIGGTIDKTKLGGTKVITPVGTMTVRGTDFFVGPIDGAYGVFVRHGEVEVANAAGSVILKDGEGTTLTRSDVAPTTPRLWPAAKIARADAMTAF